MVPRFGFKGFMNIKHMAISLVLMIIVFAILILYFTMNFFPEMERLNEERRELTDHGGIDVGIQDPPFDEIRIVFTISLILFGLLDGILAVMLWRARAPLRNKKVLSPLYSVYSLNRGASIFLILQISIFATADDNPGQLVNLQYFMVFVFTVVSIILIVLIHKKVLGLGDEVIFPLPEETL